ncbi:MAG: molybdenum cofactor biosynthesis protein MoaE [Planctomycetota bacterium]
MIEIVESAIDTAAVLADVQSETSGAALLFVGSTRRFTGELETERLDYECYNEMAIKKMKELAERAKSEFEIESVAIVHRIGTVETGEASIAIGVGSPHRKAAFEAGNWLIDTLKKEVPIWKRENWTSGQSEWVHQSQ